MVVFVPPGCTAADLPATFRLPVLRGAFTMSLLRRILGLLAIYLVFTIGAAWDAEAGSAPGLAWYKGNTHCHSFWSDGDDFPEMVADWYEQHGYQFLALSDHNILMRGEKWRDAGGKKRPISEAVIEKCRKRFGPSWVETRGEGPSLQVRLKTLPEIRAKLEEPGKFLLIENDELTGKGGDYQVHLNAVNLAEAIPYQRADTVLATLRANLQAVAQQAARLHRPILAHVNHPSWPSYHVTAEDLAQAVEARLFEVCNSFPGVNRYGDQEHPSVDRIWDIANTLRIAELKRPPLYATASDDAHHYQQFGPKKANPGRGFLMVRARSLAPDAIVDAMGRGEFYASTGVILKEVAYDRAGGTLSIEVDPQPGAKYTIEFFGTMAGYDRTTRVVPIPDKDGKPQRSVTQYSKDVGKVLSRVEGTRASYKLTGRELYVRAAIRSDRRMENPPAGEGQCQEAWCQPVGWEKRVKDRGLGTCD